MGTLVYGSNRTEVTIDDRVLAHLRLVILAKLRRSESFAFNVDHALEGQEAASTIWMQPAMELEFNFAPDFTPQINKVWADRLMHSANSVKGLEVIPETAAAPAADDELSSSALAR
ncbi:MAG: ATP-dependent ligase [Microbacteriaceae bacterium]|nr:ATP-dependent ligase [Microbacteriaceae bacterium]